MSCPIAQGLQHEEKGEIDQALFCYEQAIVDKYDLSRAYAYKACLLFAQDKADEAEHCDELALKVKPNYVFALGNLAVILLQKGRLSEALQLLNSALKISPNYWRSYYNRAHVLINMGQLDKALRDLERCQEQHPKDANEADRAALQSSFALTYERLVGFEKAILGYEEALKTQSHDIVALTGLARIYERQGDFQKATSYLDRAFVVAPASIDANQTQGRLLLQQDKAQEALPYLIKAYELRPDLYEPTYNLACVNCLLENFTAAIDYLAKALEIVPEKITEVISDSDLEGVRDDVEYLRLIESIMNANFLNKSGDQNEQVVDIFYPKSDLIIEGLRSFDEKEQFNALQQIGLNNFMPIDVWDVQWHEQHDEDKKVLMKKSLKSKHTRSES